MYMLWTRILAVIALFQLVDASGGISLGTGIISASNSTIISKRLFARLPQRRPAQKQVNGQRPLNRNVNTSQSKRGGQVNARQQNNANTRQGQRGNANSAKQRNRNLNASQNTRNANTKSNSKQKSANSQAKRAKGNSRNTNVNRNNKNDAGNQNNGKNAGGNIENNNNDNGGNNSNDNGGNNDNNGNNNSVNNENNDNDNNNIDSGNNNDNNGNNNENNNNTDTNNIFNGNGDRNFCRQRSPIRTLADGTQNRAGSCAPTVMGVIPQADKMISTIILSPANGARIRRGQDIQVAVKTMNMNLGFFEDPNARYYVSPQTVDAQGNVEGHQHAVLQRISQNSNGPPDPRTEELDFFKGLDQGAVNGMLTTTIAASEIESNGEYRLCTLSGSRGHQPVIMPMAQRGAQDDCIRFTIG